MANQSEQRYSDPEEIALGFGHVERRIDDIEVILTEVLVRLAEAETVEERRAALERIDALPTMAAARQRMS